MDQWILRLTVALLFVVVETIFVVALHTYFARPVDRMKNWFSRHSRRTVVFVLPLLFSANFAVTFLFSGLVSPAALPDGSDSLNPAENATEAPSTTSDPREDESSPPAELEQPIPGVPADDTLQ